MSLTQLSLFQSTVRCCTVIAVVAMEGALTGDLTGDLTGGYDEGYDENPQQCSSEIKLGETHRQR